MLGKSKDKKNYKINDSIKKEFYPFAMMLIFGAPYLSIGWHVPFLESICSILYVEVVLSLVGLGVIAAFTVFLILIIDIIDMVFRKESLTDILFDNAILVRELIGELFVEVA